MPSKKSLPSDLSWPKFRSYFKGESKENVSKEWENYKKKEGIVSKVSAPKKKASPKKKTVKSPKKSQQVSKSTPKTKKESVKSPKKKVSTKKSPISKGVFPSDMLLDLNERYVFSVRLGNKKLSKQQREALSIELYNQVATINNDSLPVSGEIEGNEEGDEDIYTWFSFKNNPKATIKDLKPALKLFQSELSKYFSNKGYIIDIQTTKQFFFDTNVIRDIFKTGPVNVDAKSSLKNKKKVNYRAHFELEINSGSSKLPNITKVWGRIAYELDKRFSSMSYSFTPIDKKLLEYNLVITEIPKDYDKNGFIVDLEIISEEAGDALVPDYDLNITDVKYK